MPTFRVTITLKGENGFSVVRRVKAGDQIEARDIIENAIRVHVSKEDEDGKPIT